MLLSQVMVNDYRLKPVDSTGTFIKRLENEE
jgi:hypothetical protein